MYNKEVSKQDLENLSFEINEKIEELSKDLKVSISELISSDYRYVLYIDGSVRLHNGDLLFPKLEGIEYERFKIHAIKEAIFDSPNFYELEYEDLSNRDVETKKENGSIQWELDTSVNPKEDIQALVSDYNAIACDFPSHYCIGMDNITFDSCIESIKYFCESIVKMESKNKFIKWLFRYNKKIKTKMEDMKGIILDFDELVRDEKIKIINISEMKKG